MSRFTHSFGLSAGGYEKTPGDADVNLSPRHRRNHAPFHCCGSQLYSVLALLASRLEAGLKRVYLADTVGGVSTKHSASHGEVGTDRQRHWTNK